MTTAYTTWGYTPTTYWYNDETTVITITSLIPCPVTSYTTVYQCASCPGPIPPPVSSTYTTTPLPPEPECTVVCPIKITTWRTPTTIPYYPGEYVTVTPPGDTQVITPATASCSYTYPAESPEESDNGLSLSNSEDKSEASSLDLHGLYWIVMLWSATAAVAGAGMIVL